MKGTYETFLLVINSILGAVSRIVFEIRQLIGLNRQFIVPPLI